MDNQIYLGWLRYYKMAHSTKSPVRYNKERTRRLPLAEDVFEDFIDGVSAVLKQAGKYLDKHHIKMPAPLWKYNKDDKTTWFSSLDFAFEHLLSDEMKEKRKAIIDEEIKRQEVALMIKERREIAAACS